MGMGIWLCRPTLCRLDAFPLEGECARLSSAASSLTAQTPPGCPDGATPGELVGLLCTEVGIDCMRIASAWQHMKRSSQPYSHLQPSLFLGSFHTLHSVLLLVSIAFIISSCPQLHVTMGLALGSSRRFQISRGPNKEFMSFGP